MWFVISPYAIRSLVEVMALLVLLLLSLAHIPAGSQESLSVCQCFTLLSNSPEFEFARHQWTVHCGRDVHSA